MKLLELSTQDVKDIPVRNNFDRINNFFAKPLPLAGFQHFEITFHKDVTNGKIKHFMSFAPIDLIQTSLVLSTTSPATTATITWNYEKFSDEYLDVTVAGLLTGEFLTVRFLLGETKLWNTRRLEA